MKNPIIAVDFDDTIAIKDEDLNPVSLIPNAKEVGGGKKQIFSITREYGYGTKAKALEAAKKRVEELLTKIKKLGEE